jgi:hypothetical protein
LKELEPVISSCHRRFHLDYCGEGGEYESLVLNCKYFKRRIIIDDTRIQLDDEDITVGNLVILNHHTEDNLNFIETKSSLNSNEQLNEFIQKISSRIDLIPTSNDQISSMNGERYDISYHINFERYSTVGYDLLITEFQDYAQSSLIFPHEDAVKSVSEEFIRGNYFNSALPMI